MNSNTKEKIIIISVVIIATVILSFNIVKAYNARKNVPLSSFADKLYHVSRDTRERSDAQLKNLEEVANKAIQARDAERAQNEQLKLAERMNACSLVFTLLEDDENGVKKIASHDEYNRLTVRQGECMGFTNPGK